ncbi:polysaccharide biosynthesis tyrosine autokinase [Georgenia yuyongxinii]
MALLSGQATVPAGALAGLELRFILGYALLLLWAYWRHLAGAPRWPTALRRYWFVVLLFHGFLGISALWAPPAAPIADLLTDVVVLVVLVAIPIDVARQSPEVLDDDLWLLLALSAALYLGAALLAGPGDQGRYSAFGGGPNVFVRVQSLGILAGAVIAIRSGSPLGWIVVATSLAGVALSGSRGGTLALISCAALALPQVVQALLRRRVLGRTVVVCALLTAVTWWLLGDVLAAVIGQRFVELTLSNPYSSGRGTLYEASLAMFAERPVAGWGLGGFFAEHGAAGGYLYAHNIVLNIGAEGGLIALALFFSALAAGMSGTRLLWMRTHSVLTVAGLYFFAAGLFSGGYYDLRFGWLFLGLGLVYRDARVPDGPSFSLATPHSGPSTRVDPGSGSLPSRARARPPAEPPHRTDRTKQKRAFMELHQYLGVFRKRWMTIVAVASTALAVTVGITMLMPPQYTASTRMFFSVQGGESITDLAQGSTFTSNQLSSYAEVATTPLVLDPVIGDLDLPLNSATLAESVSITVPDATAILEIAVTEEDPILAATVANAIAAELATTAADLTPERPDGSDAVRATVVSPAAEPDAPSSPVLSRNLVIGGLLGLLLGAGMAFLREILDTRVRTGADVAELSDVAVIASVPYEDSPAQHRVFLSEDPFGARAEAVRRLRTNLQFVSLSDRPRSIVVTSPTAGEGKSTTAVNLAVALADAGSRVILVDGDLRRPSVAAYMGLEGSVGLTTVLIGRAEVDDVVQPWGDSTLDVLSSGQVPPNPSELLGSSAMRNLLEHLTDTYDYVVLDSPPLLPVTDAAVLSTLAGGTIMVIGSGTTHKAQVRESLTSLASIGTRPVGLVLNKAPVEGRDRYYYSSTTPDKVAHESPGSRDGAARAVWPEEPLGVTPR